jgi:hypothetical protein
MTIALDPDRNQLEIFIDAMFRHAGHGGYVSLRSFLPNNELLKPIRSVALNGSGSFAALVDAAEELARRAANYSRPAVFCPPIAVFESAEGWQAREQDLSKGLVLSVECDEHPDEVCWKLEEILGPATAIVRSGGVWIDPEDGRPRDKLHIHWRLQRPAMGEALAVLKEARRLATAIVGADPTNVPALHCLRWPGSWHRKGTPRLCEMFAIFPDAEIDLDTAIAALRGAAPKIEPKPTPDPKGDPAEWSKLIGDLAAGRNLHSSISRLAAKYLRSGMSPGAAINQLRALMDISVARRERPDDWKNRYEDIPRAVETAVQKYPRPGDPPKQEIKLKTLAEFCGEYVPLACLIEPWLRASALYTLTAVTGHGKTGLLIIIALTLATGRADILGRKIEEVVRGRVAFLTFENPDDVRMRFMVGAFHFNIDLNAIGHDLKILDMRIKPEETIAKLEKDAAEHGPFGLIIVDTFAAFFDGDKVNDPVQGGEFMRRMRPLTKIAGQPAVIVAAHPIKNAIEDNLIPYGTGAILNEIDGNLTLWKKTETGFAKLHWQGKLRGIEFEPLNFRFEIVSSPDVVDAKGREIMLPIVKPADETDDEDRSSQEGEKDLALLLALIAMPDASQRELASTVGQSLSTVNHRLQRLARKKLVEQTLNKKWRITKGTKEATPAKKPKKNSNGEDDADGEG